MLVHGLRALLTETDPATGELTFLDLDPMATDPIEAYVCLTPCGQIRVVIYRTGETEALGRLPAPDSESGGDFPSEIPTSADLNLAANLDLLMKRQGITLEQLAEDTGLCPVELGMLIEGETSATLDMVLNLGEYFGVTVQFLLAPPTSERPSGWN